MADRRRVLFLYWHPWSPDTLRNAIRKHLAALEGPDGRYDILYYNIIDGPPPEWLRTAAFDAVILHTLALTHRWHDSFQCKKFGYRWIAELDCAKIALPQDEYDDNESLDEWLYELGVDVVFTNFGASVRPALYPIMHTRAEFVECLTGYVDEDLIPRYQDRLLPIERRPIDIVYRAAHLQYWFGSQGQLKYRIAGIVKEAALAQGLRCNISTRSEDTITGHQWLDFLASSRAVIGCESGSTCLDRRGEIKSQVRHLLHRQPDLTFEETSRLLPAGWDDHRFLAVSPRHFEAVLTRTCQVLVKGRYDGILVPEQHYIPLEPDFSNLRAALGRLRDHHAIQEMVDRAWDDIIASGRYTHRSLATLLEAALDRHCRRPNLVTRLLAPVRWPSLCRKAGARASRTMRVQADEEAVLPPDELPLFGPLVESDAGSLSPARYTGRPAVPEWITAARPGGRTSADEGPRLGDRADALVLIAGPEAGATPPAWAPCLRVYPQVLPVFVVLPGLGDDRLLVDERVEGVTVVHVARQAGGERSCRLEGLLRGRDVQRPVYVTDDPRVADLVPRAVANGSPACRVFVLPGEGALDPGDGALRPGLADALEGADLVVCPTEAASHLLRDRFRGPVQVLSLLHDVQDLVEEQPEDEMGQPERAVFVSHPLESAAGVALVVALAERLPDWQFHLGGVAEAGGDQLDRLRRCSNVRILPCRGERDARWQALRCRVAFLPCTPPSARRARILAAVGVPVVSGSTPWIESRPGVFHQADTVEELVDLIPLLAVRRDERAARHELFAWMRGHDAAAWCRGLEEGVHTCPT